jgi:hypothetical protein
MFSGRSTALDSGGTQMRDRAIEVRDPQRHMPVTKIDLGGTAQRSRPLMDDEVELTAVGALVPRTA